MSHQSPAKASTIVARWSSYWVFILAAIGSSVGLGNVWKFPYEMGLHGGGTFLLVYVVCVLVMAFPLMMAEIMIGRRGHSNLIDGIRNVAQQAGVSKWWQWIGWLAMLSSFLIFSFYSVVGGWILFYIMSSVSGSFVDVPAEIVQNSFGALLHNSDQMLIWQTVFVLLVVMVLGRGVHIGLERAVSILMPCFLGVLLWLCFYTSQFADFSASLQFVLSYDLTQITPELIVSAFTQALFSLSIGMGVLIMYGAYLNDSKPIFTGAGVVMIFDTLVALVMALLIFSVVFAFGMQPDVGAGLIFQTLPVAFSQMSENSVLISTLFFTLLLVAALTSGFALLEPIIVWMVSRFSIKRQLASWLVGMAAWGAGWLSVYSFAELKFSFYYFDKTWTNGSFDLLNLLSTHLLLPIVSLLVAIFTGWKISKTLSKQTLSIRFNWGFQIWRFSIRIIAPIVIISVLSLVILNAR